MRSKICEDDNIIIVFLDIIHLSDLFKTQKVSETGFRFRLQVEPIQFSEIDGASPYLRTPAPREDRVYKSSTAQIICESLVKH
jgi:hypothetical protein